MEAEEELEFAEAEEKDVVEELNRVIALKPTETVRRPSILLSVLPSNLIRKTLVSKGSESSENSLSRDESLKFDTQMNFLDRHAN